MPKQSLERRARDAMSTRYAPSYPQTADQGANTFAPVQKAWDVLTAAAGALGIELRPTRWEGGSFGGAGATGSWDRPKARKRLDHSPVYTGYRRPVQPPGCGVVPSVPGWYPGPDCAPGHVGDTVMYFGSGYADYCWSYPNGWLAFDFTGGFSPPFLYEVFDADPDGTLPRHAKLKRYWTGDGTSTSFPGPVSPAIECPTRPMRPPIPIEGDPNDGRRQKARHGDREPAPDYNPDEPRKREEEQDDDGFVPFVLWWGAGPPPAGQFPRRPGRKRDHKARGAIQKLLHMLDIVSESAEVVDAIFDALPCDVQKRAKKGRKRRGLIDNAGQYGIDGADWKLAAIADNWNAVDGGLAVANVIRNELQDRAYGAVYKGLSGPSRDGGYGALRRSIGRKGIPTGNKQDTSFNDLVDKFVDTVSDTYHLPPPRQCGKGKG